MQGNYSRQKYKSSKITKLEFVCNHSVRYLGYSVVTHSTDGYGWHYGAQWLWTVGLELWLSGYSWHYKVLSLQALLSWALWRVLWSLWLWALWLALCLAAEPVSTMSYQTTLSASTVWLRTV